MNKVIPLKLKIKKRIPWEISEICQKRDILHKVAKRKDSPPTQVNIEHVIKAYKSLEISYDLNKKELYKYKDK